MNEFGSMLRVRRRDKKRRGETDSHTIILKLKWKYKWEKVESLEVRRGEEKVWSREYENVGVVMRVKKVECAYSIDGNWWERDWYTILKIMMAERKIRITDHKNTYK